MNDLCLLVDKYTNLLKPSLKIGTEFTQALRAQRQVLEAVRLFGISPTLTLISITGEIARITQDAERET